jgi:hypothetical protein
MPRARRGCEVYMNKTTYDDLIIIANYAICSKSRDLVLETYGMVKMARTLCAITKEQFLELSEKLITKGINNPRAHLE